MTQIEHRTKLLRLGETEDDVAHHLTLHRALSAWMGGALPPTFDTSRIRRVLVVGCGVGVWVRELAQGYPRMQVYGVDASRFCIEQAKGLTRDLDNVMLLEEDMYRLEEVFDTHSFDLISVRFMAGTVSVAQFPPLLEMLTRLCRRNGVLILTEAELPLTSSHACDYLSSLILSAMLRAGLAFTPAFSPQIGLMSRLRYWTRALGYTFLRDDTRYFDISHAVPAHNMLFRQQVALFIQRIRPFLLASQQVSPIELDDLCTCVQEEIAERGFCGACPVQTLVAVN